MRIPRVAAVAAAAAPATATQQQLQYGAGAYAAYPVQPPQGRPAPRQQAPRPDPPAQPPPGPLRNGDLVEFNTVQAGWVPGAIAGQRQDGSLDVQAAPAVGGGYYAAWKPWNIRRAGSATPYALPLRCPSSLNITSWTARERTIATFSWDTPTDADFLPNYHKPGMFRGQDDRGQWFPVVLTRQSADGTFSGYLEAAGSSAHADPWEPIWRQYLQVKRPHAPKEVFRNVRHSACAAADERCARGTPAAAFAAVDAACVSDLRPQWWASLTSAQTQRLPISVLSVLPAPSCAALGGDAARGLECDAAVGAGCAGALPADALSELSPRCVARLPDEFFQGATEDAVGAVMEGRGGQGLTPRQVAQLSDEGCLGIDLKALGERGADGEELCRAIPPHCWATPKMAQGFSAQIMPRGCFAGLSRRSIAALSDPMRGAQPKAWCDGVGAAYAADVLGPQQRGALHTAVCEACQLPHARFAQCPAPSGAGVAKRAAREWAEGGAAQSAALLAAAAAAFAAGAALRRRRGGERVSA